MTIKNPREKTLKKLITITPNKIITSSQPDAVELGKLTKNFDRSNN